MNDIILNVLPGGFRKYLEAVNLEGIQEIRLRATKNAILYYGACVGEVVTDYIISAEEINESLEYISNFSLYAYEDEIRDGFITIRGGHRVGLAGKVIRENGKIKTIGNISSINIRVSHQIVGCSDSVMTYVVEGDKVFNTLIISPPGAGKTTLLRDMLRQLSDVHGKKVSIVDERSEIAACFKGIPQNQIGVRTDVYDCCPKTEGIMLMIRAMSPNVVAVDEIGNECDMEAIKEACRCGCNVIATIHGESVEDVTGKGYMKGYMKERVFKRFIFIKDNENAIYEIYDELFYRLL